jgi:hypothetical protein
MRRYAFEFFCTGIVLPACLLTMGELGLEFLREFMTNSLIGAALDDATIQAGADSFWKTNFGTWQSDDGIYHSKLETFLVMVRGLKALLTANDGASRVALQAWLPPINELLRITKYECAWRTHSLGANHPALLCARLHGERLGDWKVTVKVAEALLHVEEFNPLLRCEAWRLLGRAKDALGDRTSACEAVERAAAEAAAARFGWLEMLSLRDMLHWTEAETAAAQDVQSRLRAVHGTVRGKLVSSAEDIGVAMGSFSR